MYFFYRFRPTQQWIGTILSETSAHSISLTTLQSSAWVFGGTERITGESFLVEVTKRDAATLLTIIRRFIKPGSDIYSDEWRAYSRLQRIGYGHNTVNHSVNFVDPATGAHTQTVESMWSAWKRMMREEKTMHSSLFDTYLPEFMWRRKFDSFHSDSFANIIAHISEQYPQ